MRLGTIKGDPVSPGSQGLSEDTLKKKLSFLSSATEPVETRVHYVFAGGCEGVQNGEKDLGRAHTCPLMFEMCLNWRLQHSLNNSEGQGSHNNRAEWTGIWEQAHLSHLAWGGYLSSLWPKRRLWKVGATFKVPGPKSVLLRHEKTAGTGWERKKATIKGEFQDVNKYHKLYSVERVLAKCWSKHCILQRCLHLHIWPTQLTDGLVLLIRNN